MVNVSWLNMVDKKVSILYLGYGASLHSSMFSNSMKKGVGRFDKKVLEESRLFSSKTSIIERR